MRLCGSLMTRPTIFWQVNTSKVTLPPSPHPRKKNKKLNVPYLAPNAIAAGLLWDQVRANDKATCYLRQSLQNNFHQLQALVEIIVRECAKLREVQPNNSSSKVRKLRHIVDELENQERPETFAVKANPANQGLTMANGVFNLESGVMPGN